MDNEKFDIIKFEELAPQNYIPTEEASAFHNALDFAL